MNNFQMRRFGLVLRRDLTENRKRYLQCFAGMFLACLIVICGNLYTPCQFGYLPSLESQVLHRVGRTILFTYVFSLFPGIADAFHCLCTKQRSINYLMLPASPLEKFVSRLLIFTVLWTAGFVVVAVLADLVRMLLFAPFRYHLGFSLIYVPDILAENAYDITHPHIVVNGIWEGLTSTLFVCGLFLWHHSLYLLGSSVFRKRPFFCTALAEIVCGCLLAYVFSLLPSPAFSLSGQTELILLDCIAALTLLLAAFNYWVAYRNFRRCPVVGGKWFHL